MVDISQPVSGSFIAFSIAVLLFITALGIVWVKLIQKRHQKKEV